MALRATRLFLHPLKAGIVATLLVLAASPGQAQRTAEAASGPFGGLAGSWTGNGVVKLSSGSRERVRCRATYVVESDGHDVRQELRCASDAYKFEMSTNLVLTGDSLSGYWSETTRRIAGKITGRATATEIQIRAEGDTFSALLDVSTHGDRQSLLMTSPGSQVSEVSIALNRTSR